MGRTRTPEGKREIISVRVSDSMAAGIDAAIACASQWQGMTRPQWVRVMLDTQLKSLAARGHIEYGSPAYSPATQSEIHDSPGNFLPNPLRSQPHTEVIQSSREDERAFRAEREGNWATPEPYETLATEDLPEIHDHSHEAWDTETGSFPCGCDESVFPQ